jgi:hypothetical protein
MASRKHASRRGAVLSARPPHTTPHAPQPPHGTLKALGAGANPVWGAVKGAIGGLSTKTKVLIVLALVLGLLLGPVALVVVLLALLVFAVVAAVRTRAPT